MSLPAFAAACMSFRYRREYPCASAFGGTAESTGSLHTRTTANWVAHWAEGTRTRSLNYQPPASVGFTLAASTSLARGAQFGLVFTNSNL